MSSRREPFASISSSSSQFGNRASFGDSAPRKLSLKDAIEPHQHNQPEGKPRLSNSTPLKRLNSRLSGGEPTPNPQRLSSDGKASSSSRANTPTRTASRRSRGLEEMQQRTCSSLLLSLLMCHTNKLTNIYFFIFYSRMHGCTAS